MNPPPAKWGGGGVTCPKIPWRRRGKGMISSRYNVVVVERCSQAGHWAVDPVKCPPKLVSAVGIHRPVAPWKGRRGVEEAHLNSSLDTHALLHRLIFRGGGGCQQARRGLGLPQVVSCANLARE